MSVLGVKPGATGTFTATPDRGLVPQGVVPQWLSSDPSAVVTPAADGMSASVAVDAGSLAFSFGLSVSATIDGQGVTGSVSVPILQPVPTSFTINQIS